MGSVPERPPQPIAETPLGLFDLLDGSFAALRQRARTLVSAVALLVVPVALLEGWVSRDDLGGATFGELLSDPTVAQEVSQTSSVYDAGFFLAQLLALVVTAVSGVVVSRVVHGWVEGRDTTAAEALAYTARRGWAVAGAFVVVHLVQLGGFVLLVLPGFAVVVLSALTSPVLAIEEHRGPVSAMRRSWELVRRRPGPVLLLILLLAVVQALVSQAVGTVPEFAALFLGPDRAWPLISAARLGTRLILLPVNGAAMCLLYLDIRYRTEGLDLHHRMVREFAPPVAVAGFAPVRPEDGP